MADQNQVAMDQLISCIGQTPLVLLRHICPSPDIRIYAKLEGQNPSGSVKDRIACALIEHAEARGELRPGMTLFEASSGNTAIALAFVARQRGYQLEVVLPKGIVPSICDLLTLLDVRIHWFEPEAGMKGAIRHAEELAAQHGGYAVKQFNDAHNVETHYQTTGVEILAALPQVDAFVSGIGTGGTIMGVGRRLKETLPNVQIVGIEPKIGERLQGLCSLEDGFVPPLLDLSTLDRRFMVDAASAIKMTEQLAKQEGILAGISAGATLHIALRLAQSMKRGNIVVMFSDGGWKYLPARPWADAHECNEKLDEIHWW